MSEIKLDNVSNIEAFNGMSEIKLDNAIIVSSALSLSLSLSIW